MSREEEEPASPTAQLMQSPNFNLCIIAVMGMEQTLIKHPCLSSILVTDGKKRGNYSWKQTRINLENHVFTLDLDPNMESLDIFVEDYTSTLSKTSFDQNKPLWEVHILNVKTSDANSTNQKPIISTNNGLMKRFIFLIWTTFLIVFYTLIDCTFIKGSSQELSSKRFVHRIISLDDVKLVKNAMNVSINDVILGVTEAGLSQKDRENKAEAVKKPKLSPKNLCLRSAVVFNLKPSPTIEDLAEVMEKEKDLNGKWGNLIGVALLPLTIALQEDPLAYINRAKATMDRKKLSLEPKCAFTILKLLIKLFGIKVGAAATSAVFSNTTFTFSNVVGPQEEIILFGHPLCYIAPSVSGFPQALVVHYQSYGNKLTISLAADETLIPNPHQLCDDLQKSLENIKETIIKRGLVKDY
ncbi:Long-chain-alcohol O-fatty-acyltransferase [Handroanthus impetiginosus]|uniref:Long-chain-alcohol O-fatty-acyltransferase n=1 Tax=Handroanthus impetiginosus TaxID=429701 RepID=A0A2G9IBK0_9LAMI|nr:Long-chain-alcohol O-fatty-acyltransferase [Handroanthus impetiginosus]